MHAETAFVMLFAVASAVAMVARRLGLPYTVALVLAGLGLGAVHAFEPPHLTKELVFAVFLPGLLFEAAFHLDFQKFWRNRLAIHALAVPGVVASIGVTALLLVPAAEALAFVDGFTLVHGLVFGALIAATDPIAVVSLFRTLGAPSRLSVLVEGESLLNDGTGVVLFGLVLAIAGGAEVSVGATVLTFVKVVGAGALIGLGIGYAISKVIQQVDDAMVEITLTTVAAYGSFVAAEQLHFSGVIATVAAGMLCGNYGARTGMSPSTRVAVETFWEYLAFALNSIVFLLIGFEVNLGGLARSWKAILVAYLVATLGRGIVIAAVGVLLRRSQERLARGYTAVLIWGGLRGGLSMVLVLALPQGFAHRELLVHMTFGVVLLSILIQGLSMGPLLRRLGLVGLARDRARYERGRAGLLAAQAARDELEQLARRAALPGDLLEILRAECDDGVRRGEEEVQKLHVEQSTLRDEAMHATRRQLLQVQKDAVLDAVHRGVVGREVAAIPISYGVSDRSS